VRSTTNRPTRCSAPTWRQQYQKHWNLHRPEWARLGGRLKWVAGRRGADGFGLSSITRVDSAAEHRGHRGWTRSRAANGEGRSHRFAMNSASTHRGRADKKGLEARRANRSESSVDGCEGGGAGWNSAIGSRHPERHELATRERAGGGCSSPRSIALDSKKPARARSSADDVEEDDVSSGRILDRIATDRSAHSEIGRRSHEHPEANQHRLER